MAAQSQPAVIRIMVIAPVDGLDQEWIESLQSEPGVFLQARIGVVKRGIETVQQLRPNVLLIDRTINEIESTIKAVTAAAPETLCIALLPQQDMQAVRRLVSAGARDILIKPLRQRELLASIRQVVQMEDARRQRAGQPSLLAKYQPRPSGGQVIVVIGPKGGVGTTTVATNLAVALRRVSGREVALADFSLQSGDVALLLDLSSQYSLHDLAANTTALDDRLLAQVLVPHESGIKALLAPIEPELAADVTTQQAVTIVGALRQRFGYIVIDCWPFVNEITETLLTAADQVLLVTTPEVLALKNTRRSLNYLIRHGVRRERIALVLNRFPGAEDLSLREIQQHLRHTVQANLPNDEPTARSAANLGVPVVQSQPQSWLAQSFLKLAAWTAGDDADTISYQAPQPNPEPQPDKPGPRWRWRWRRFGNSS